MSPLTDGLTRTNAVQSISEEEEQRPKVRAHRRLVKKDGNLNIQMINKLSSAFVKDIFTTVVDMQWRYFQSVCRHIVYFLTTF